VTRMHPRQDERGGGNAKPLAVREYIGSMALEMARLARDEGDMRLANLLEQAAGVAGHPAT